MPEPNDGLELVILAKEWLDHKPGDVPRVDPRRAEWLRANGYAEEPHPEIIPEVQERPRRPLPVFTTEQRAIIKEVSAPVPVDEPKTEVP
jgi:hypothetical protein